AYRRYVAKSEGEEARSGHVQIRAESGRSFGTAQRQGGRPLEHSKPQNQTGGPNHQQQQQRKRSKIAEKSLSSSGMAHRPRAGRQRFPNASEEQPGQPETS